MNRTTRKHPRTLQEAFGPHCSDHIETDEHAAVSDLMIAIIAVCVIAGIVIGVI